MTIRDTSIAAFQEVAVGERQRAVLEVIRNQPGICDYSIAEVLKWRINCVTPRRNELYQMGLIVDLGAYPGPPAGRPVHHWKAAGFRETLF